MAETLLAERLPQASDDRPYTELGRRLAEARDRLGWSQRELAQHMEASSGYIARIETGRNLPSLSRLRAFSRWLGVDFNELSALAGYTEAGERDTVRVPAEALEDAREFSQWPKWAREIALAAGRAARRVTPIDQVPDSEAGRRGDGKPGD